MESNYKFCKEIKISVAFQGPDLLKLNAERLFEEYEEPFCEVIWCDKKKIIEKTNIYCKLSPFNGCTDKCEWWLFKLN